VMDAYEFYRKQMASIDQELEKYLAAQPSREAETVAGDLSELPVKQQKKLKKKLSASRKQNDNRPAFDIGAELARVMGVDLRMIDGIDVMTAQTIYSEIGTDLSSFPSEDAFASWLELVPRDGITGGKKVQSEKRVSTNRVTTALRNAAESLVRSDSYLGARYRYYTGHLEGLKGVKATAHYLALLIYRLLTKGPAFIDRGAKYFEDKRKHRELLNLHRKAADLGLKVVPA